jgi:hypothetical protein
MVFASDTFAGSASTELSAYNAAWSKQNGWGEDMHIGVDGQYACKFTGAGAAYRHSGSPASADYSVFADLKRLATGTDPEMGVCGRMAAAADTFYYVVYGNASGSIRLFNRTAGSNTQLGSSYTVTFTLGQAYNIELRMSGNDISVYLDSSLIIGPVTDGSPITSAGKAGIYGYYMRNPGTADTGSIDNFSGVDAGAGQSQAPRSMQQFAMRNAS